MLKSRGAPESGASVTTELEGGLDQKRGQQLKLIIKENMPLNLRIKLKKILTDFCCETFSQLLA